jgi:hypothetical protein
MATFLTLRIPSSVFEMAFSVLLTLKARSAFSPIEIDSATPKLDHEGVSLSQKMRDQELRGKTEYPTRNYKTTPDSECGKTRVLVDETIQLLGHFTNEDEETTKLKAMEAAQGAPKRRISPHDY